MSHSRTRCSSSLWAGDSRSAEVVAGGNKPYKHFVLAAALGCECCAWGAAAAERDWASSGAVLRRRGRRVRTEKATLLFWCTACRASGAWGPGKNERSELATPAARAGRPALQRPRARGGNATDQVGNGRRPRRRSLPGRQRAVGEHQAKPEWRGFGQGLSARCGLAARSRGCGAGLASPRAAYDRRGERAR